MGSWVGNKGGFQETLGIKIAISYIRDTNKIHSSHNQGIPFQSGKDASLPLALFLHLLARMSLIEDPHLFPIGGLLQQIPQPAHPLDGSTTLIKRLPTSHHARKHYTPPIHTSHVKYLRHSRLPRPTLEQFIHLPSRSLRRGRDRGEDNVVYELHAAGATEISPAPATVAVVADAVVVGLASRQGRRGPHTGDIAAFDLEVAAIFF